MQFSAVCLQRGLKVASRRRVDRAGHISGNQGALFFQPGVGQRDGVEQDLGVRVERIFVKVRRFGQFHDLSQIHHGHPVRDALHHPQIVRDEKICDLVARLEVHEQVQDLRLD